MTGLLNNRIQLIQFRVPIQPVINHNHTEIRQIFKLACKAFTHQLVKNQIHTAAFGVIHNDFFGILLLMIKYTVRSQRFDIIAFFLTAGRSNHFDSLQKRSLDNSRTHTACSAININRLTVCSAANFIEQRIGHHIIQESRCILQWKFIGKYRHKLLRYSNVLRISAVSQTTVDTDLHAGFNALYICPHCLHNTGTFIAHNQLRRLCLKKRTDTASHNIIRFSYANINILHKHFIRSRHRLLNVSVINLLRSPESVNHCCFHQIPPKNIFT